MPIQTYKCNDHGEFEIFQAFADDISPTVHCPHDIDEVYPCGNDSLHIIKPIAAAIVQGGTGGGKDMHLKR